MSLRYGINISNLTQGIRGGPIQITSSWWRGLYLLGTSPSFLSGWFSDRVVRIVMNGMATTFLGMFGLVRFFYQVSLF